jgi:protein O-mannosyl-transferase
MARAGRESKRQSQGDPAPRPKSSLLPGAAIIFVATLAMYAPALHGGFLWDDDVYISQNAALHDLDGLKRIWVDTSTTPQYYPLTFTTYWLEYRLWGLDTFGYHVVNVLLHATSAILVWRILLLLGVPGAWLAGAIFALHPIQVESVAWMTERKNTLSGVFYLLSAMIYLRYAMDSAARAARRLLLPLLSVALVVCALLSKSVTASLPVALLIVLWWKKGRLERRHWLPLGLMLAAGAAKGVLTAILEVKQVGAHGAEWSMGIPEHLVLAGRIFWFYLGKLAWPASLSFSYERWTVDASSWLWWAFPAATIALVGVTWAWRRRMGRGPLAAVLFYGVTLSPALGFLNVYPMRYSYVADHFAYLAILGPVVVFAALAASVTAGWSFTPLARVARVAPVVARCGAALLLAVLAVLSWRQAHAYRDFETVWRDAIAESPRSWLAHFDLGKLLLDTGRTDQGLEHLRRTIELKPDNVDAYNDIGSELLRQGRTAEALSFYEKALRYEPDSAMTRYNLGAALGAAGDLPRAEVALRDAIRFSGQIVKRYRVGISPLPWMAYQSLGALLLNEGREDEARDAFQHAVEANPAAAESWVALGTCLTHAGRWPEAIDVYRRGIERIPRFGPLHYGLGRALDARGDPQGAAAEYRAAIAADPGLAAADISLAIALFRTGDFRGAWSAIAEARQHGVEPPQDFVRALSEKMSAPGR